MVNKQIKGLILDVDGVLVGNKKGYNWPQPNKLVINELKKLHDQGLKVCLCSGKGTFSIKQIVQDANLDNSHISDGGAVISNPIKNEVIKQFILNQKTVMGVLNVLKANKIYTELYTKDNYYIEKIMICDKTSKHIDVLNQKPKLVPNFSKIKDLEIVKIMTIANNQTDKETIVKLFNKELKHLNLQWGVHPTALPYQFGFITGYGVSKKNAFLEVAKLENIGLDEFIGIGDGLTDWQFMEMCGYAGAMGNSSKELIEKIKDKNERGCVGLSVDENGVLDILRHFDIIN